MYGIPNMKLEKHIIDRRINLMKEEGIEFVTGVNVGTDIKANKLLKEYDVVILACGAGNPRDIKAEGRDAEGIYFAVDYLKSVTKSLLDSDFKDKKYIDPKGKNVVVIGGGDTGNDCVGTSIRLGCKSITQLEMMPKAPDFRTADNPCHSGQRSARQTTVRRKPSLFSVMTQEYTRPRSKNSLRIKTETFQNSSA